VPHLCKLYPGICLKIEGKSRINFSQGSRKVSVGTIKCVRMATLRVARISCRSRVLCFMGPGLTLGQRREDLKIYNIILYTVHFVGLYCVMT
jgi:hypothetical protein